ncbi:MAG: TetR/AcrR family transcriptional repressor of nem operon [Bacteroidia bacterium]
MNIKHDKENVIKKGVQLFWCKGYSKLGVDEICKTTGMTKGAFYNAFKSKENFLLACLNSYDVANVAHLTALLRNDKRRAIDRILNMYISMLEFQPKKDFTGCLTNNMMSEIGSINDTIGAATAQSFENLLDVIDPVVQKAQIEGDISSSLNSRSVSELIHSAFFGFITRAKSHKDNQSGITSITLLIKSLKTI